MNFESGLAQVQTVLGEISVDQLGFCQCHEHLFLAKGKPAKVDANLWMDDEEKTVMELYDYKRSGGSTVVDAQPIGSGRMEKQLVSAAQRTGVHIVASTGFHKLDFYWENHWIHQFSHDQLAQLFIDEAKVGMYVNTDNTAPREQINAKAGIIKTAVDTGNIKKYEKYFEAAATTAKETGLSIMCHIEKGSEPFQVIEFLWKRGIQPYKLILCHVDRTHYSVDFHLEILKTGVHLEYDTIGRFKYHSDEEEAFLIEKMIESGFQDQLLLSLDTTRARLKHYGGIIGLDYLITNFIPLLIKRGVAPASIQQITINNPQKILAKRNQIAKMEE